MPKWPKICSSSPVGAAVDVVGDDDLVAALQQREAGRHRGQSAGERERAHAAVQHAHLFLQRAAGGVVAAGVGIGCFSVVDERGGLVDGAGDGSDAAAVDRRGVGQQGFDMEVVIQGGASPFFIFCHNGPSGAKAVRAAGGIFRFDSLLAILFAKRAQVDRKSCGKRLFLTGGVNPRAAGRLCAGIGGLHRS